MPLSDPYRTKPPDVCGPIPLPPFSPILCALFFSLSLSLLACLLAATAVTATAPSFFVRVSLT